MDRSKAESIAAFLSGPLANVKAREWCGSFRRGRAELGDLDLVCVDGSGFAEFTRKMEAFEADGILKFWRRGPAVFSFNFSGGAFAGEQVDVWRTDPVDFEACVLYATGSKAFNIRQRKLAAAKGYILNERGLWTRADRRLVASAERAIFEAIGMAYVEPEARE